jgi:hypothetical protein
MAASILINKIILPDRKQWKEDFLKSEVFDKLKQISIALRVATPFQIIDWDLEESERNFKKHIYGYTSREMYMHQGRLTLSSLYMIDYLIKNTKEYPIIDIGCGMNLFKSVYPIIGLDNDPRADIQGIFNEKFMEANMGKFSAAIAINSLHFIHLNQIQYRIKQFSHIIQPNGLGYITLNTQRLIDRTNEVDPEFIISKKLDSKLNLRKYVFAKVYYLCDTLELLYYEDNIDEVDDYMDGNIKIIFRKKHE